MMKLNIKRFLLCAVIGVSLAGSLGATAAEAAPTKIAIVYFSQTGNTRYLAEMIKAQTGGELIELIPQDAYSQEYREVVARGKRELEGKVKPPLKDGKTPSIENYDVVFIGSPNWFNTYATPLATFFAGNSFKGKVVIPFCTYGSRVGNTLVDITKACPGAVAKEGFGAPGKEVKEAKSKAKVQKWLDGLGFKKQ
ncbi:MAG TPA: flavodoxin [Lentisphaeria bacterium]|nr:flavodoxin [Lentisphaeria bacterium]